MERLTELEAAGMTVNERLVVSGLMPAFDQAIARGDEPSIREILASVFLDPNSIDSIVRRVLHSS